MAKKKKAKETNYGLSGNSGLLTDDKGTVVMHLNMPYGNNDENTVFVVPKGAEFDSWRRMTKEEAKKQGLTPIKCSYCKKPAVRLDHSWPWMMGTTSCKDHLDRYDAD